MMEEDDKYTSNTWHENDLPDTHHCAQAEMTADLEEIVENQAYDMTGVLQLPIFKHEVLNSSELLQSLNTSLREQQDSDFEQQFPNKININQLLLTDTLIINQPNTFDHLQKRNYKITLKAPTAPGRKIEEETLTWLNQSQPYEVLLQLNEEERLNAVPGTLIKCVLSVGFHERHYRYFKSDKYEEWSYNRPDCKMIELDVPMCVGIQEACHVGQYSNEIEFQWDATLDARVFVKVNCLSSEFTKTKSGESGVLLRLKVDVFNDLHDNYSAACQIKVFRAKGANRKLKLEREKHEALSKDELAQLQTSKDFTVLKELKEEECDNGEDITPVKKELWNSPNSSSQRNGSCNSSLSSTPRPNTSFTPLPPTTLTASSNTEETQEWLRLNRFQKYSSNFASFTGDDLLRLSRNDLIQLCGVADGIRLNNALLARASRPQLTMYVSAEWHQTETGMREYHAMFLEQLTVDELTRKIANKCGIDANHISAFIKQGPTGIHIHVDDELVRNFPDEAHHVVEVIKDQSTGLSKILLK